MQLLTWQRFFIGGLAASLCACGAVSNDAEGEDDVAAEIAAAEAQFGTLEADNEACFQAFRTCRDGVERGSDAAKACNEALRACLPDRPGHRGGMHGDGGAPPEPGDGGMRPGHRGEGRGMRPDHPRGDGGMRPEHGDGGMHPGHRGEGRGMHPGHPGRGEPPQGHPGRGRGPVDHAALATCRENLHTCLDGDTERDMCIDQARACVRTALEAAFTAVCADVEARCAMAGAPADRCAKARERCAAGFPAPRN